MTTTYRALLAMLLMASVNAWAKEPPTKDNPANGFLAYCAPDIERLCPNVPAGGGRIKACLLGKKEQMSVGCAKALQALKQEKQQ
ncbi:hypothetical protein JCM19379_04950 [Methyloparacoccus murrellii]|jgi:hypothetical protein